MEEATIRRCAFCRGAGRDPFGVLSWLSTCTACGGGGAVAVVEPTAACAHCKGTGVAPGGRWRCLGCGGAGYQHISENNGRCGACSGTGMAVDGVLYCLSCHGSGFARPSGG